MLISERHLLDSCAIALKMIPNIDCDRVGAVPKLRPERLSDLPDFKGPVKKRATAMLDAWPGCCQLLGM